MIKMLKKNKSKYKMVFLEGYLWDVGGPKKAFDKAIKSQRKLLCHYQIYFVLKDIKNIF